MAISPVNGAVLAAAAVVVSPTWWFAYQGTLSLSEALTRYLLVVPLCWAAINLVAEFFFPRPGTAPVRADEATAPAAGAGQPEAFSPSGSAGADGSGFDPGLGSGFDGGFDGGFGGGFDGGFDGGSSSSFDPASGFSASSPDQGSSPLGSDLGAGDAGSSFGAPSPDQAGAPARA